MNAKALSIMRYLHDINTEHNIKSQCAARQWLSGQSALLATDKRKFTSGKAQIFFYYTGVAVKM